jgi:uncharacterized protein (TIGR02231 family)
MRSTWRLPACLVAMLAIGNAFAQTAPITAVVLYPGSASVVRTANVESGATQLTIPQLSNNFALQNLRIDADPGIHIGQVESRDESQTASANPAQAALEARIQTLADEVAALDAEAEAANIVKGYLERLGGDPAAPGDRARAPADPKTLAALLDVIGRGAGDALAKVQRIAMQKRERSRKIDALEKDLAHLRASATATRTLVVHLNASRSGSVRLAYPLNSAGWKPGYRAELDSSGSTVTLTRTAQVSQKTGEDWNGVRLVLSTTQPRLSPVAPSPQPWLLSYAPPLPPGELKKDAMVTESRALARNAPMPAPAPMAAAAKSAPGEPGYVPPTFQTDGVFATEFEVTGAVTLAADGKDLSLDLAGQLLPVRQKVQVTPRLDKTATVTAEADRPAGVWLAGNTQVYRDGNYVGAFAWNPQAAEKFILPFGRDDLVRVTLDHVKGDQGSTGLFERRNQRRIADRITVTSAHTTPVDVLVIEASPVSTSEEITVETRFDPEPAIKAWDERRGVVAWEKALQPKESATITVDYRISYPKDGMVSGLHN